MPEGLVESALFGHEKGAFTGATVRTAGAFERAHGGTLLLDEISEMRHDLQAKLLRVIQEQEFERVGGHQAIQVDVRVIATTNRDLKREVEAGRFRPDLYYRLNVVPILSPPLRERVQDIPVLVQHFARRAAEEIGVTVSSVAPETIDLLLRHSWPGNVRELANVVERAVILSRGGVLRPEAFQGVLEAVPARPVLPTLGVLEAARAAAKQAGSQLAATTDAYNLDELERVAIQRALAATGGNRTRAAKLLGISERTLRNKLKIRPEEAAATDN
jgi:DNA-binding NtrC family response regulator